VSLVASNGPPFKTWQSSVLNRNLPPTINESFIDHGVNQKHLAKKRDPPLRPAMTTSRSHIPADADHVTADAVQLHPADGGKKEHPLRAALRSRSDQLMIKKQSDNGAPLSYPVYTSPDSPSLTASIKTKSASREVLKIPPSQRYHIANTASSSGKVKGSTSAIPLGAMKSANEFHFK
jgi:hypothetical protein